MLLSNCQFTWCTLLIIFQLDNDDDDDDDRTKIHRTVGFFWQHFAAIPKCHKLRICVTGDRTAVENNQLTINDCR